MAGRAGRRVPGLHHLGVDPGSTHAPCPNSGNVDCIEGLGECDPPRHFHQVVGNWPNQVVTDIFVMPVDGGCLTTVFSEVDGKLVQQECGLEAANQSEPDECRVIVTTGCRLIKEF